MLTRATGDRQLLIGGYDGTTTTTWISGDSSGNLTFPAGATATTFTGALTGNADTATTLATARTIAGVSFDGSSNIAIASTDLSNTSNVALLDASQTLTNKTLTTPVIAEIDATGDFTLDAGGDIILNADGGDFIFRDGSTEILKVFNSSSDVSIKSQVQDKDIKFLGNDGGSGITALTLDMSEAGSATFNHKVTVGDTLAVSNGTGSGISTFTTTTNRDALRTVAGGVEGVALGAEGGAGHSSISLRGQRAIVGGNGGKGLSIGLGGAWSTVPASSDSIHLYGNVGIGTGTSDPGAPLEIKTTATTDTLLLTSTEASSTASPVITLKRNSSSVADADYHGAD